MRKFGSRMATLAAAVGIAAFIVVSAQADSRDERKSEESSRPVPTVEFLSLSFTCQAFGTTSIQLLFSGSGDLTGGSGNISVNGNVASATCNGVTVAMQEVTAGLSCVNSAISGVEPFLSFQSVCQAPRTELVNVMGEVSRTLMNLSVTP